MALALFVMFAADPVDGHFYDTGTVNGLGWHFIYRAFKIFSIQELEPSSFIFAAFKDTSRARRDHAPIISPAIAGILFIQPDL